MHTLNNYNHFYMISMSIYTHTLNYGVFLQLLIKTEFQGVLPSW